MDKIIADILSPDVTLWGGLFKLLLSLLLGSSIGFERRLKGQIAGLRTFALIAMGATLAMLISIYIPQVYFGLKNGDPGRIAAQVVSGVGFLGAGAIIQMKGSVRGLTTAAGIWMTACIGLAVGAGMYLIAIAATVLILFILVNIERFEQRRNLLWESRVVRIRIKGIVSDFEPLQSMLHKNGIHITNEFIAYDYENRLTIANYLIRIKDTSGIPALFEKIHKRYDLASIALAYEVSN